MGKTTTLAVSAFFALLPFAAHADNAAEKEDGVTFYGYMAYSDAWNDSSTPDPQAGFYSFTAADGDFKAESQTGGNSSFVSCTYGGNRVYRVDVGGYYSSYTVTYSTVSADTWKQLSSASLGKNYAEGVAADMTYDYTTSTLYSVTYEKHSNSNSGYLCIVDKESGAFTRIASIPFMRCVAADAAGALWSIGGDGVLYKMGKDGTVTKVGETGYIPSDLNQSATFDLRTGKLYWALDGFASDDTYHLSLVDALLSVDTATGKAEVVRSFGRQERFSGLFIKDCHPAAPDRISDLSVTASADGALEAAVSFTMPKVTYGQTSLSTPLSYTLYKDFEAVKTGTAAAGEHIDLSLDFENDGTYTIGVSATADGREGSRAEQKVFVGGDTPLPVTGAVAVSTDDRASATISWEAPAGGVNGGSIAAESVTYTVTRMPDNKVVAKDISATSFTDTPERSMIKTRYTVTPKAGEKSGERVFTNYVYAGTSWEVPYTEAFDTEDDFGAFTVIDANGDAGDDWEDPTWKYDNSYAAAFYYGSASSADDWLVMPALELSTEKLYQMTFQTYGYYGKTANHLQIALGALPTAESMGEAVFDKSYVSSMSAVKTFSAYFTPREGDRYIGFHNITQAKEHMSIDNIYVHEIGSSLVPDRVSSASIKNGGDCKALLSFTAPATNVKGEALAGQVKVNIYKGSADAPVAVLTGKPGEEMTWTDEYSTAAAFTYTLTPENGNGAGIPTELSIDMTAQAAAAPTGAVATLCGPHTVKLTWKPSATAGAVNYSVYRRYDYETPQLVGDNLTECSVVDDCATDSLPEGQRQGAVRYTITSINSAGEGGSLVTDEVVVGEAYPLPFSETWYQQTTQNEPWTRRGDGSASWSVVGFGYDPKAPGYDGAGMVNFSVNSYTQGSATSGISEYVSPAIDFTSMKNPVLNFYIYHSPDVSDYLKVEVGVEADDGSQEMVNGAEFYAKADEAGWTLCTVPLSNYAFLQRGHIVLRGSGIATGQNLHLDALTITGGAYGCDAAVKEMEVTGTHREGAESGVYVVVKNNGSQDIASASVSLMADGAEVASEEVEDWKAGAELAFDFEYVPTRSGDLTLCAKVAAEGDEQPENDSMERTARVQQRLLPYVTTLSGSRTDKGVTLSWQQPTATETAQQTTDGFEQYKAFAIADIGLWGVHDGDQTLPFTFNDMNGDPIVWENNDKLQAFIVFNPGKTTLAGLVETYSGEQSMVSFGAPRKANDDWLISPPLSGEEQLISFYARGIDSQETSERFNVLYSLTDTAATSFHTVNGTTSVKAGTDWTLYRYGLPQGARYFAIQYVGVQQSGLMVDDVTFCGYIAAGVEPDGYNVYRDGVQVNADLLTEAAYAEEVDMQETGHTYTVTAVYGGKESSVSNEVTFSKTGISAVGVSAADVRIGVSAGFVHVRGAEGKAIKVYDLSGKLVHSAAEAKDMESFAVESGVYVVRAGGRTAKVLVR